MAPRTIVKILRETSPRTDLCRRLGISPQYASNIARGQPIGGAETLARFAGRHLLATCTRAETGEILLSTLEHDYPEHFEAANDMQGAA